ncbi:replication factor RFC1 C terminal domain-containing protein [Lasiosphaeria miniovina]|uniref:Replication factor C subunit 1 n=1 Tax=Lasiosphaeria miniovina TaxID=1954250 RepID=A0AA39ZZ81_9PEZI|nr:replication factor RFC1 C terminal domain-containing protein [Lasiosphaeria miniovina]KAK0706378.1 replication factor RFC1 C terminal domain-containing protein [Lasiosphaeria miniovina]
MPDIRSFFGPKGGAPPPKPLPKKADDTTKKLRTKGRKVIDDSDDDDDMVVEVKKPTRSTPRKKASQPTEVKGVETSASQYFASAKPKAATSQSTPKAASKTHVGPGVEVRMSPRTKPTASRVAPEPATNGSNGAKKKPAPNYANPSRDDDFVDDDDEDGEDIFMTDVKGGNKRKNDDYAEEESEEEFLPKPKRVVSRAGKPQAKADSSEDFKPTPSKSAKKAATPSRKRKTPVSDSEDEEDDEIKPAKKPAPAKPRAPRAKKAAEPEPDDIRDILDNVPTVQAPDAPAKDPNAKFDWRKGAGGGNAGPPPMAGAADIPDGEDNCLMGKSFVFTGLLKTISRDEGVALVKRYGGKVTGAPSSKTDFVVLGDDAGPSKLRKIQEHGIKAIDEAGLFYLIKTMPAHGGTGKGAEKAKQKREVEEKKACDEAVQMEREEKARQQEAAKAAKIAAAARGVAASAPVQTRPLSQLWTTKYAPTQLNQICGNKANVERIQSWLKNWPKHKKYDFQRRGADGMGGFRAIIISGPPGIGKTTAAHLAANLEGYDVLESNASDTRSKKLVESGVSDVLNNTSLLGFFAGDGKKVDVGKKKMVLVMDEVDGMSAGDRGGVGALAKFCKKTEVPLILICNERRLPKMKPFDHVAFDIKFQRPTVDQIRSRVMTIAHREGMKLPAQVVNALIEGSNKDIRQIVNMLSTAKLDQVLMDFDQTKSMTKAWEKHVILKPWDICQKMIGGGLFGPASKATLNDKIELYFNDHEFSYLMIQENYLRSKPALLSSQGYSPREQNMKYLELVDQAAESISDGDLVDRMIHGPQQQWSLMPTHAVFSTVRPSSFIAGSFGGQTAFTSWLGNNSKYGKLGRFVREVHSHMRLKTSGDHNEVRQQYLPVLWHQIVKRLEVEGRDCVEEVIELMDSYYLTREDFDSIKELGVGYQAEEHINIETQTKAAFTRTYNAMSHPLPFMKASSVVAPKKGSRDVPDLEEAIEEEDEGDAVEAVEVDEEELDLKTDKYIKQPKKTAKKPAKKAAKANDDDDDDDDGGKAKGRRRPKKK